MSNHNHRRGHGKIQGNGPRFEAGGSNDACVARARKKWKRRISRALRRTGHVSGDKFPLNAWSKTKRRLPDDDPEGG